jgi:hypothetical protein
MVNACANPGCGKPLHYLREGRIFLFELATGRGGSDRKPPRHVEHFWLCGACSESLTLRQSAKGIDVVRKLPSILERGDREFGDEESIAAGVPF